MNIEIGQQVGVSKEWDGSGILTEYASFVDSTAAEYLRGVGQRFYTEFDYNTGLELLNELIAHPLVQSETLKLFQEVIGMDYIFSYANASLVDKSEEILQFTREVLERVDITEYLQSCLATYITGLSCAELIWGGTKKNPELQKIKYINPALYKIHSNGVYFRKSFNSGEFYPFKKEKFLTFSYSTTVNTSFMGNGVGKILFYLIRERNELLCMARLFAKKGITPTLVVNAESGVSRQAVINVAKTLNSAEDWKVIPVPKGIKIEAIQTNKDYALYSYLIAENEKLIVKLISGEAIIGNDTSSGSSRTATEATNLRRSRSNTLVKKVVKHINKDIIELIIDLKFGKQAHYPKLSYNLPSSSATKIATISEAIALSEAFGYKVNPEFFEKKYSLDILNEGGEVL